jgi:ubiquinone/menaquinone biosynthesis C-methylase UbiE
MKREKGIDYISADLNNPRAMVKMDITNIQYPDESFDLLYCSHVLEHVNDDKKAIKEIYRVLKVGGTAVIMVPIKAEKTFENTEITNPAECEKLFGHHDHVRKYGLDFIERLKETHFDVEVLFMEDVLTNAQKEKFGLKQIVSKNMPLYLCKK